MQVLKSPGMAPVTSWVTMQGCTLWAVADCMTMLLSLPCDLQPEFLPLIPSFWACRTLSRPWLLYSL